MNITKVFGFILALHLGVILVLFIQPGCHSTDIEPPTQSDYQANTLASTDSDLESVYGDNSISEPITSSSVSVLNEINDEVITVSVIDESLDTYKIKSGDTLWDLAKSFDTTVNELCELNSISKNSILRIGSEIKVPRSGESLMPVTKESALDFQPSNYEGTGKAYKVVSGDSLSKIATRFDLTVASIKAINGLSSDMIYAGQELLLPLDNSSVSLNEVESVILNADSTLVPEEAPIVIGSENLVQGEAISEQEISVEGAEPVVNEASQVVIPDIDAIPEVDYRRMEADTE